jgi:uncharacterized protein (DUF305 family)
MIHRPKLRATALALATLLAGAALHAPAEAQEPPRTVQPGAPGQESRVVTPGSTDFEWPTHVPADVSFMQMMIGHHAQALEMSELVPERSARDDVRLLAQRIHMAQFDEIALMARWLHDRGEEVPPEAAVAWTAPEDHAAHAGHGDHHGHHATPAEQDPHAGHGGHDGHAGMPGMLTPAQLEELAAASGDAFDRLFLEFMIFHHEGAILMVHELFASPEGGQEGEVYQFAAHVDSDQRIEIERMRMMLARVAASR